jgi:predicted transcriptional regulator
MRRSKLELHLDILNVLGHDGPISPTRLMYKVNLCYQYLEQYLDLLIKQGLVERRIGNGQRAGYMITQKGIDSLRTYRELKRVLPIHSRETVLDHEW